LGRKNSRKAFSDLNILIPGTASVKDDIPTTLVFIDNRIMANRVAKSLRRQLPAWLQSDGKEIIRVYHSPLDDAAKATTAEGLTNETTRIVVCTDAFGMGVNVKNISRVVQWSLNSQIGIKFVPKNRSGRAGFH
jgi:Lhr-like helicase